MITTILVPIFQRELTRLKEELNTYQDPESIWLVGRGINNSAGNLTLHLLGNLNPYICAVLGNSGYQRDRAREFSDKQVPIPALLSRIDDLSQMIDKVLHAITAEQLEQQYPQHVLQEKTTTGYFLITFPRI